ncbi:DUF5615 family PIN-like protein [Marinobacter sp. JSM 1782161]|uniref:DUF5615 family PIN-like protein n=1 Tax=Marinobacter sp. JSM 1782161 TaxID=2685906 RepID=UPI0014038B61|nr:DUF5615 family PIN-like protein [Marinobacter sp. JSM 1782161]
MTGRRPRWIEGALCPLEAPRFLCDEMLRGFGQWLRVAGYDTTSPASGTQDRDVLGTAIRENRWLITRDRELELHRNAPHYVLLLESNGMDANFRELTRRLNLNWLHDPFSRCKRCNTPLRAGQLPGNDLEEAGDRRVFCHCPGCRHVYWEGSHVRRMRARLLSFNRWRTPTRFLPGNSPLADYPTS